MTSSRHSERSCVDEPGSRAETPAPNAHKAGKTSWKDAARQWVGRLCVPWLPHSYMTNLIDDYYIDQEPKSFFKQAVRDEVTRRHYNRTDAGTGRQPEFILGGHRGGSMARGAATAVSGPSVLRGVSQGMRPHAGTNPLVAGPLPVHQQPV